MRWSGLGAERCGWRHAGAVVLAALTCTQPALARERALTGRTAQAVPLPSHEQIDTARRVLRSDSSLAHLFRGTGYRVAHLGPWTTSGAHDRLIGVVFFVDLEHPMNAAGLWPEAVYEPREPFPSYSEHFEYFRVVRLRSAMISVDLQRRAVADVRPGAHG